MRSLVELALVGAGGALGAMARFGLGLVFARIGLSAFPWATLAANVLGGLAMGLLVGFISLRCAPGDFAIRAFWGVGLLGGFTTFSAFSIEMIGMMERRDWLPALLYGGLSIGGALGACALGLWLGRRVL